jgi:hypothetical protein
MAKKPMKKEEMAKKPMKKEEAGKANGLTPSQKKLPPALQAAMLKRMKKK